MLRSINQLHGKKLGASDGEIGHVEDFYFDDQQWVIRYVVADTGSWLPGRLVLLSPRAFGTVLEDGNCLLVNLTKQQIENSPAIETHEPVSRRYEEEYHLYYGWPSYWDGGGIWGAGGFPVAPPFQPMPREEASRVSHPETGDDSHLRSTEAVTDYEIQASDGVIGHVTDFIIDDENWVIRHILVRTGHWYSNKRIALSTKHIQSISCEATKVSADVTRQAIPDSPEYHVPPLGEAYRDTRNFD